jgi:hypothetical protein
MAAAAAAPNLYHPTQLEEAYALYLLEQELGISPSPPTSCEVDTKEFRISGRQAVPLLTRSGVDRTLLRTFWTIADPQNVGTLTNKSQVHVLLRLIAMTQAGVIASLATVESSLVQLLLHQYATHPLPLPTFDGVMIPEAAFLMTTYWAKSLAVQPLSNPGQSVSIDDAFGDLPILDTPLPPLVEPVVLAAVPPDAPFETAATSGGVVNKEAEDDEEEFGNFESVVEPTIPAVDDLVGGSDGTMPVTPTIPSDSMPSATFETETISSFSSSNWPKEHIERFYSAQEFSVGRDSTASKDPINIDDNNEEEPDDDFGDFKDAQDSMESEISAENNSTKSTTTTTLVSSNEMIPTTSGAILPSPVMVGSDLTASFGGLNHFPSASAATTDVDDPFSAFDALAPPPVPLTSSFELPEESPSSTPVAQDESHPSNADLEVIEALDDFGDFEAAEPVLTTVQDDEQSPVTDREILDNQVVAEEQPEAGDDGDVMVKDALPPRGSNSIFVGVTSSLQSSIPTDPDDPFSAFDALVPPVLPSDVQPTLDSTAPEVGTDEEELVVAKSTLNGITGNDGCSSNAPPEQVTETNLWTSTADGVHETKQLPTTSSNDSDADTDHDGSDDRHAPCETAPTLIGVSSSAEDLSQSTKAIADVDTLPAPSWSTSLTPNSAVLPSSPLSDDPFSAFDALVHPQPELPPLPPLSSLRLIPESGGVLPLTEKEDFQPTSLECAEVEIILTNNENEPPTASSSVPTKEVMEDDDFGDFMFIENPTTEETNNADAITPVAKPIDLSHLPDNLTTAIPSEALLNNDFGNFTATGTQTLETTDITTIEMNSNTSGQLPVGNDLFDLLSPTEPTSPPGMSFHIATKPGGEGPNSHDFSGFGDFAAAVTKEDQKEFREDDPNIDGIVNQPPNDVAVDDDDFGDFEAASHPVTADEAAHVKGNDMIPITADEDDDAFGDFETVGEPTESENRFSIEDSNFGDFDAFHQSEQNGVSHEQTNLATDLFDAFGDFDDQDEQIVAPDQSKDLMTSLPKADHQSPENSPAPEDDECGAFHDTPASPEWEEKVEDTSDDLPPQEPEMTDTIISDDSTRKFLALVRTLSPHLPSQILWPSDSTSGVKNFISQIDANVRALKPSDEYSEIRMRRCADVLLKLSSTHAKLVSTSWNQILTIIRDEMAEGVSILEEAIALSPRDLSFIRENLRTMVGGLGEQVRICRSLVATIGDLLCMDASSLLTDESWSSSWCSISLLELALESEQLWKAVQLAVLSLRIGDAITSRKLESVNEIRKSCLQHSRSRLCQLTLQPFTPNDKSTRSEIMWEGKSYYVGAANLWANRVSTVAP